MIRKVITVICIFLLGVVASQIYEELNSAQMPFGGLGTFDRASPSDWVSEEDIHVFGDRVTIDGNFHWASFKDTNSMDPLLDSTANAIQIVPEHPSQISVGDIISYKPKKGYEGTVIHRVAHIGEDENGLYFIAKGDNNPKADSERIRFNQIKRVTVAIIY